MRRYQKEHLMTAPADRPLASRRWIPGRAALAAPAAFAAALCWGPVPEASAGLVSAGKTGAADSSEFARPEGTVLATRSIPFTLEYKTSGSFAAFPGTVNAVLENAVVRD